MTMLCGRSAAPGMVVAQWQAAGMTDTKLPRCRELIQVPLTPKLTSPVVLVAGKDVLACIPSS